MADTVSPEERLFNIIKDGKDSGSGGGVSKPKKPSLDSSGIKKFFGSLKLHPGANKIDPKSVNRILSVALAAAAAFFVYYLFSARPDASKITRPAPKAGAALKLEIEKFAPLDSYIAEVKKRDIFKPAPKDEVKGAAPTSKEAMEKLKEAARDLKVVGVSWGEEPKALLRSEKDKTTYFLKQGQKVGTMDVDVRVITREKIKIGYRDETYELP
ncbi:MAG: hypothetical protein WC491_06625 [Candidatus Omnitrophota bacterium]